MIDEKRHHPRFDSRHLLHFIMPGDGDFPDTQGMGRTLNVSHTGILIETYTSIEEGRSILLTIGIEEDLVVVKGRVVHTKPIRSGAYTAGIEFSDLSEASRQVLDRYIRMFEE